jgi:hypothetical protein
VTSLLCMAALVPFVPEVWQFLRRGVPDLLFTGDGAALELGTLHAARGIQLLGPYSRFGWSHPGPAYFYLALPFYEAFGQRGPALNVFALVVDGAAAVAIVLTARRLRGGLFALVVAALLAVYALVGLPFLLANEWNPILPILPLALLTFLAARLAGGHTRVLPGFAFVGSAIVQTHVAYAPEVIVLLLMGLYARPRPKQPVEKSIRWATMAVMVVLWSLPVYEAISVHPGNIQQLIAFFAPRHLSEHPWGVAVGTIFQQMAVMPVALARTLHAAVGEPGWQVALGIAVAQLVLVAAALEFAAQRADRDLAVLATMVFIQCAVAILAVRAIRGDIEFYLVAWASLLGFLSFVVLAAWLIPILRQRLGVAFARAIVVFSAVALLALVISEPVTRGPVFRDPDPDAERLARTVETYLRAGSVNQPTIRVASDETWPAAVAVVLYLYKQRIPISVETRWLTVVGRAFTAPPGTHPALLFGDRAFDERARTRTDLTRVAAAGDAYVYRGN